MTPRTTAGVNRRVNSGVTRRLTPPVNCRLNRRPVPVLSGGVTRRVTCRLNRRTSCRVNPELTRRATGRTNRRLNCRTNRGTSPGVNRPVSEGAWPGCPVRGMAVLNGAGLAQLDAADHNCGFRSGLFAYAPEPTPNTGLGRHR